MPTDAPLTRCCRAPYRFVLETERVRVTRCRRCGTEWADHIAVAAPGDSWEHTAATAARGFLSALSHRREIQAKEIVRCFGPELEPPILDYGCGQGRFFNSARAAGLDIWACDIELPKANMVRERDRFVAAGEIWSIPTGTWRSVVLLDVLEHHNDPRQFIGSFRDADLVLLKVPLGTGPIAVSARSLARIGRPQLFEALLQVGDHSPHQVFFTLRGLDAVMLGYRRRRTLRLPEVGIELVDRMARSDGHRPSRWLLRTAGWSLATVATVWSDTLVALYERSEPHIA